MQNKFVWSFLSLVTLATGSLLGGCDSDAKIAKSALGESCDKTSDCDDGLKCLEGTCYKKSTGSGGSSSNAGGEGNTAGTAIVGPKPPVLGGLGESCTKRADCEDGLACLAERCSEDGAGVGGEGSGGPALGGPGETCGLTSDCVDGLRCLPNGYSGGSFDAKAIGSNSVGVCTQLDSGLKPTGKACGAECAEAADCCELPVAQQTLLGAYSCADLAALVADVPDCATAVGVNGKICLAYNAYCDENCGKNTWSCDAGKCSYTAKCTKAGEVVGGCPLYTRGGHQITACDTLKSNKCLPAVTAVVGCNNDAKCAAPTALAVADSPGDTCSDGECACHVETGACYRKCSEDLDCRAGYRCDADTTLCVPVDSCHSNAQCAVYYGDSRATCTDGVCQPPGCEHDIDCNPYGLVDGQFSRVCVDKACVSLAGNCSDDAECGAYTGTAIAGLVRSFCTEPEVVVPGVVPVSAITD